jgi:sulfoxide reductase heme-binding subunit YedZ
MARTEQISARPSPVAALNGALRRVPPWTLYIIGAAWGAWLFWLALTGGLGAEPITELEHRYGELAINLLVAGLAVTPLRQFAGLNLMPFRRAIGVLCFFFVIAHLLVWAVLDVQTVARVWADIVERPYVTIGMAGSCCCCHWG